MQTYVLKAGLQRGFDGVREQISCLILGKYTQKDSAAAWKATNDPQLQTQPDLSAKQHDYGQSNSRIYCDEDNKGNEYNWDGSPCTSTKITIHKSHMIAASYRFGHGGQPSVDNTFIYTNAVP